VRHTVSGAYAARPFNPNADMHYAISEDADLALRDLFAAMDVIGLLTEQQPGNTETDVDPSQLAPLWRTFARFGERLLDDCPVRFPADRRKSA